MGEAAVPLRTLSLKKAHGLQRDAALLNCRNLNEEFKFRIRSTSWSSGVQELQEFRR